MGSERAVFERAEERLRAESPEAAVALEPLEPVARLVAVLELGGREPAEPVATALLRLVVADVDQGRLNVSSDVFSPVAVGFATEGLVGLARWGELPLVVSVAKATWRTGALMDVARTLVDAGELDRARALRDAVDLAWRDGQLAPLHALVTMAAGESDAKKRLGAIARGARLHTPEAFACMVTGDDGRVPGLPPDHPALKALHTKLLRTRKMDAEAARTVGAMRGLPAEQAAGWLGRAEELAVSLVERESPHAGSAWLDVAGMAALAGEAGRKRAAEQRFRKLKTGGLKSYPAALLVEAAVRNANRVDRGLLADVASREVGLRRIRLARALGDDSLLRGGGNLAMAALGHLNDAPIAAYEAAEVLQVLVERGDIERALAIARERGLHLPGHAVAGAEPPLGLEQLEAIADDARERGELPYQSGALTQLVEGLIGALRRRGDAALVAQVVEAATLVKAPDTRTRCLTDVATLPGADRAAIVRALVARAA